MVSGENMWGLRMRMPTPRAIQLPELRCVRPPQEFGLQEDAAKFGSEMARLERMQAAAAAAPAPAAPAGRITAQRPPTSGGRLGPLPTLPPPTAGSPTSQQQRRHSGMFAATGAVRPPTRGA